MGIKPVKPRRFSKAASSFVDESPMIHGAKIADGRDVSSIDRDVSTHISEFTRN